MYELKKSTLTFFKFCHIIIIQKIVTFDIMVILKTTTIDFGVPLPKALKCGTI